MAQMVKPSRPMPGPKLAVNKDEKAYTAWGKAHKFCQACGDRGKTFVRQLSTHHIIKVKRSHDYCNLLRLCQRCHDLAELLQIREGGVELAKFYIGVCLNVKRIREPEQWNPERLAELFGRPLPDLLPIPRVIEDEYRSNRPSPYRPAPDDQVGPVIAPKYDDETVAEIIAESEPAAEKAPKKLTGDRRCPRCVRLRNNNPRRECPACKARGAL